MEETILPFLYKIFSVLSLLVSIAFLIVVLFVRKRNDFSRPMAAGAVLLPVGCFPQFADALLETEKLNEMFIRMTPFLEHETTEDIIYRTADGIEVSPHYFDLFYSYPGAVGSLAMLLIAWGLYLTIRSHIARLLQPNPAA